MIKEPQDPKEAMRLHVAMNRFATLSETSPVVEWLKSELDRLDKANRHEGVDVLFKQSQGACQVLEDILNMVLCAETKVEKLRTKLEKERSTRR